MPTEAAANVVNIIFFFSILFIWLLICAGENRPGNACTGKAVLGQKSLKDGEFGAVYGWAGIGTDAARTRPNRGVSRGDRGDVRGLCEVVLAYNFLLEDKTYILVRRAFHLRKPCDVSTRISQ